MISRCQAPLVTRRRFARKVWCFVLEKVPTHNLLIKSLSNLNLCQAYTFATFPSNYATNFFPKFCFCFLSKCWLMFETDASNEPTTEIIILAFLKEYWRNSWRYSEKRWASITTTNFRIIIWFFENIIINPNVTDKTTSLTAFYS